MKSYVGYVLAILSPGVIIAERNFPCLFERPAFLEKIRTSIEASPQGKAPYKTPASAKTHTPQQRNAS